MISLKFISVLAVVSAAAASGIGGYHYNGFGSNGAGFGAGAGFGGASDFGGYSGYGGGGAHIPIRRYENVNNGDGNYRYNYETGNGISAHESGSGRQAAGTAAEGGFSYQAPNGQTIALSYTADERGFRPTGAHLPTPPPIPEAILRSIEFNRQHPSSDDGAYNENGRYNNGYNY